MEPSQAEILTLSVGIPASFPLLSFLISNLCSEGREDGQFRPQEGFFPPAASVDLLSP
jgi:hypothetical protein